MPSGVDRHGGTGGRRHRRTLSTVAISSPSLVDHEADHVAALELLATVEEGELDDEAKAEHGGTQALDETHGRGRRAAGCQHVIDDDHVLARVDGVLVDLQKVGAV